MFALRDHENRFVALESNLTNSYGSNCDTLYYELSHISENSRALFVIPSNEIWQEMLRAYQELQIRRYESYSDFKFACEAGITVNDNVYYYSYESLPEIDLNNIEQMYQWTLVPLKEI